MDRDVVPPAGVEQAAVEILQQPGAILGERMLGLVEDHIMRRRQGLESDVGALFQPLPELVGRHGYERLVGRHQGTREAELAVRLEQHRLPAVLAMQAGHHAPSRLVADAEAPGIGPHGCGRRGR